MSLHYCESCWTYNIETDADQCPLCWLSEFFYDQDDRFDPDVWCGGNGKDLAKMQAAQRRE